MRNVDQRFDDLNRLIDTARQVVLNHAMQLPSIGVDLLAEALKPFKDSPAEYVHFQVVVPTYNGEHPAYDKDPAVEEYGAPYHLVRVHREHGIRLLLGPDTDETADIVLERQHAAWAVVFTPDRGDSLFSIKVCDGEPGKREIRIEPESTFDTWGPIVFKQTEHGWQSDR
jgi:hypothetical protein